ncbi:MAG TPA: hypothetical protein VFN74_11290 [Chloroflexota bacterium]|nr:hypothetical protein [Chloroflexota bacterium]
MSLTSSQGAVHQVSPPGVVQAAQAAGRGRSQQAAGHARPAHTAGSPAAMDHTGVQSVRPSTDHTGTAGGSAHLLVIRGTLARLTAATGYAALSSDVALRRLKASRWKWLQRLNYALFVLVIVHAVYYGALARVRSSPDRWRGSG